MTGMSSRTRERSKRVSGSSVPVEISTQPVDCPKSTHTIDVDVATSLWNMDTCAELTLHLARLVQQRADATRSPVFWSFEPDGRRVRWPEAGSILSAAAKPLLVAPLVEPGALALWSLATMADAHRVMYVDGMANRLAYFDEKLRLCGVDDTGTIRFDSALTHFSMSVKDFRRWLQEYAMIAVGLSMDATRESGVARLVVRPPGGGGPFLGSEPTQVTRVS
jgi:hypothetical protein